MKVSINEMEFKTEKAAQEYAKGILYAGKVGSILNAAEKQFMVEYFKTFHHAWERKFGVGILAIRRVRQQIHGKHMAFEIVRKDGSQTDISYIISGIKKEDWRKNFVAALREVVRPQIKEYRQEVFKDSAFVKCAITGQLISYNDCHIDHFDPTFTQIASDFINIEGIVNFESFVSPPSDNQYVPKITDDELAIRFYEYHKNRAILRPVHYLQNLKRSKF